MEELAKSERMAINISNFVNLLLFISKVLASIESRSMAVIASTLDSLLDLLSGLILWFTSYAMKKPNKYSYPIGKKRMQPVVCLSLIIFFFIMYWCSIKDNIICLNCAGNNCLCIGYGYTWLSSTYRVWPSTCYKCIAIIQFFYYKICFFLAQNKVS